MMRTDNRFWVAGRGFNAWFATREEAEARIARDAWPEDCTLYVRADVATAYGCTICGAAHDGTFPHTDKLGRFGSRGSQKGE